MTRREAAVAPRESATGAIYDLGYQGYDGPRLGRRAVLPDRSTVHVLVVFYGGYQHRLVRRQVEFVCGHDRG